MKKWLFIFALIGIAAVLLMGETNVFTVTIGGDNNDFAQCIQQTKDNGYIIAGYTLSYGVGNYDVYLVKTDPKGKVIWTKTYGGKENDFGNYVLATNDGGYIITGSTKSIVPEGSPSGPTYAYLIKTDKNGKEKWSKSYGQGTYDSGDYVSQKPDGGYIVAGTTGSYSMSMNMMVLETDAKGNILEKKSGKFETVSITCPGGEGYDGCYAADKTSDGNFILAGETDSPGNGNYDISLVKMKIDFMKEGTDQIWEKTFGGKDRDYALSVRQTSDGGYIIGGNTGKMVGEEEICDIYVIKTNSKGDEIWSGKFGGEKNDICYDVLQTVDEGFIIAGYTYSFGSGNSDAYIIKTDEEGKETWSKTFGGEGNDAAYAIRQTSDGGFVIAGYNGSDAKKKADIYIIKLDSMGIKPLERKYSYRDFITAAEKQQIGRVMEYVGESVIFIEVFRGKEGNPEKMGKEMTRKMLEQLLGYDPDSVNWKINENDKEKNISCFDGYVLHSFYFKQTVDKLILVKIVNSVAGL